AAHGGGRRGLRAVRGDATRACGHRRDCRPAGRSGYSVSCRSQTEASRALGNQQDFPGRLASLQVGVRLAPLREWIAGAYPYLELALPDEVERPPRSFGNWVSSNPTPPAAACTMTQSPSRIGYESKAR